jgi:plasmid stabilization system protein ParE
VVWRFLVSPQADRDLDAQADYYLEQEGLDLALRFYQAAEESFALLASQPDMGSSRRFEKEALQGVRWFPISAPFKRHLIFYRRAGETVEILRVLHANQNIEALLDES